MRVVITGIGVISPIGCGVENYRHALRKGDSGISAIEHFDASQYPCRIAGRVADFNPHDFFTGKKIKRMDRFSQMGTAAAQMAWEDAGFYSGRIKPDGVGVILGTGIGGISTWEEAFTGYNGAGNEHKMNAFSIPRIMNNAAAAHISMHMGFKGINHTLNTACSAGANAIGQAFIHIQSGLCDILLCGGAEAPITPGILKGWSVLKVLSQRNDDPAGACRPFDMTRDGFVLSEGAGILVLESLNSAIERNADIYAEIIGFGTNCDAHHLTFPSLDGEVDVLRSALRDASLPPEDIGYINAHGTGTDANDRIETSAIKEVFGDYAYRIPVSSTKSMIGHAMGASSALDFIATVLSVKYDFIPPTINYRKPDPECDLDYVPNFSIDRNITAAISNAFGFGGSNAVLVARKWKDNGERTNQIGTNRGHRRSS